MGAVGNALLLVIKTVISVWDVLFSWIYTVVTRPGNVKKQHTKVNIFRFKGKTSCHFTSFCRSALQITLEPSVRIFICPVYPATVIVCCPFALNHYSNYGYRSYLALISSMLIFTTFNIHTVNTEHRFALRLGKNSSIFSGKI